MSATLGDRIQATGLPILAVLGDLLAALDTRTEAILEAPPGAGKSTLVPLALLEGARWLAPGDRILVLEPRRLAARAVAARMADLIGEPLGGRIGYRVRFERQVSASTRIEVVTEGVLSRRLIEDPLLEGVGAILFDEFHERSLEGDLALALARESQQQVRGDLRLLVMSATLDGAGLAARLGQAPRITSEGRSYPLDIRYLGGDKQAPLPTQLARAIRRALSDTPGGGHVLAFAPGAGEVERTCRLLEQTPEDPSTSTPPLEIHRLYGDLAPAVQARALAPVAAGRRKVIVATSIAETSLTIEGVSIVVDGGLARVPRFDPRTGLAGLVTVPVTLDAATQRAGRAARQGPGLCYRLWSEGAQAALAPRRPPEIEQSDLAPMALAMAEWGAHTPAQILALPWVTPPPAGPLAQGIELLERLGAREPVTGRLTDLGRRMARLPTHPRLARLIVEAGERGCLPLAAEVVALLEGRDPLAAAGPSNPMTGMMGGAAEGADIALRLEGLSRALESGSRQGEGGAYGPSLRALRAWRQILNLPVTAPVTGPRGWGPLGALVAAAYPERVARQREPGGRHYRMASGLSVALSDHDPLVAHSWLAVAHADPGGAGAREGRIFLATGLEAAALVSRAQTHRRVSWDPATTRLVARTERRIGALLLGEGPLEGPLPEAEYLDALATALKEGALPLETLVEGDWRRAWQARIGALAVWDPEGGWPHLDDTTLIAEAPRWLATGLTGLARRPMKVDELAARDWPRALTDTYLPWPLYETLDRRCPATLTMPTGSRLPVRYDSDGGPPVVAVRIQEVFGLADTPRVDEGRRPVTLELLSPGYKPLQTTQDLRSFWQGAYQTLKREYRARYPRHAWPDDPASAEPVRKGRSVR